MACCIAADGGGTKIESVLFEHTGRILALSRGAGGNAVDIGVEEAKRRLGVCLHELLAQAPEQIRALYAGIAGVIPAGDFYSEHFRPLGDRIEKMRFEDDGFSLLSGTLGHSDGCAMVCGTGSSLFVRIDGRPPVHIGGKGYLIDTGGSGFELGRGAICMALRSVDGRCGPTVLTELLADMLGEPVSDSVIFRIHRGGRAYIASFASAVFEGRRLGDRICRELFTQQAGLMADLSFAAAKHFDGPFRIVLGGGIAANYPEYVEEIRRLSSAAASIVLQQAPPIYGAAVEAMWEAGLPVTKAFRAAFLADYARLGGNSHENV